MSERTWRWSAVLGACVTVALAWQATAMAQTAPAPVAVEGGTIQGRLSADGMTVIHAGIPFAAPPVGDLRWRVPQPVRPWTGTRATTSFAAGCMQARATTARLPWTMEYLHQNDISEDCLYLNVWAPARPGSGPAPVIVFLHGGGNVEGSGGVPVYDGESMARRGIVFVTVNYRLGVFGLLAHPGLSEEAGASGNYAFHDQIAALRWVKANIAALGGDPANVTVMGQSAGAGAIFVLNASPLARGLYARAILDSAPGTTITNTGIRPALAVGMPRAEAEQRGLTWARQAGYETLAALRAAPAEALRTSFPQPPSTVAAVIDGALLPDRIATVVAAGRHNDVPILAGTNRDERGSEADYGTWTRAQLEEYATRFYPFNRTAFLSLYPAADDAAARDAQRAVLRDERRFALAWLSQLRAGAGQAPSYLYFFDRVTPWPDQPRFGAFHSSELPYALGNQHVLDRPWTALDRSLSATMQGYYVNFARSGDPNGPGLPAWKAFSAASPQMMWLGEAVGMVDVLPADRAAVVAEKRE